MTVDDPNPDSAAVRSIASPVVSNRFCARRTRTRAIQLAGVSPTWERKCRLNHWRILPMLRDGPDGFNGPQFRALGGGPSINKRKQPDALFDLIAKHVKNAFLLHAVGNK